MTQIIINHCGSIANVDAMEACILAAKKCYIDRTPMKTVTVKTSRNFTITVEQVEHENRLSYCSIVFNLTKG